MRLRRWLAVISLGTGCAGAVGESPTPGGPNTANTPGAINAPGSASGKGAGGAGPDPGALTTTPAKPGDTAAPPAAALPPTALGPLPASMTRLTRAEYTNTVRDLFGDSGLVALDLEDDFTFHGSSSVGSREVTVSRNGVHGYADTAEALAKLAVADPVWQKRWISCQPKAADTTCAKPLVTEIGRRMFHRTLLPDEIEGWSSVVTRAVAMTGDFWQGFRWALAGMMLSPRFTHRVETGRRDAGRFVLTDDELAARLSFLIWDTTPDEPLLAAADKGELSTLVGFQKQADRLLADPKRVDNGVAAFAADYMALQLIDDVPKDKTRFVQDTPELRVSMRRAAQELARETVRRGDDFLSIYEAGFAFVDKRLAAHYGSKITTDILQKIDLPKTGTRVGLLTEPAFLATYSGAELTSPTRRGRFVREHLLCAKIPEPPADVDQSLPNTAMGRTRREQISDHIKNPACNACHRALDPIGFALESFDALGAPQATDRGVPVVTSGDLDGAPFTGPRDLSRLVRNHADAGPCLLRHVFRHVTGSDDATTETASLQVLATVQKEGGGRLLPLLRAVALSESFRSINGTR